MIYRGHWKNAISPEFDEDKAPQETLGLTSRQKEWIKGAGAFYWHRYIDGKDPAKFHPHNRKARCLFPTWQVDQFGDEVCCPCGGSDIHIHHISSKRYAYQNHYYYLDNDPTMLIPVCASHHIGDGYRGSLDWRNEVVPVIHPDIAWAKRNYKGKDSRPTTFDLVFEGRDQRTQQYLEFWNTDYDNYLYGIAQDVYFNYIMHFPDNPYPINENRGNI